MVRSYVDTHWLTALFIIVTQVSLLVLASVCVSWYHSVLSACVRPTLSDPDPAVSALSHTFVSLCVYYIPWYVAGIWTIFPAHSCLCLLRCVCKFPTGRQINTLKHKPCHTAAHTFTYSQEFIQLLWSTCASHSKTVTWSKCTSVYQRKLGDLVGTRYRPETSARWFVIVKPGYAHRSSLANPRRDASSDPELTPKKSDYANHITTGMFQFSNRTATGSNNTWVSSGFSMKTA